ncbi:MAG: hypothetical protein PHH21_01680 [Candidatus Pacebacteria bacterium]|nr:hypothetical protein [Candidatus Paceibacterota bacterium]
MSHLPVIYKEALGICEHCKGILNMDDMPVSMSAGWKCPHCQKTVTRENSFGYERLKVFWRKMLWVDKNKNWVKERPRREFIIEGHYVTNKVPSFFACLTEIIPYSIM